MNVESVFAHRHAFGPRKLLLVLVVSLVLSTALAAQNFPGGIGAVRQPRYTGDGVQACLSCHFGERMQAIAAGPHGNDGNPHTPYGREGCESCHGPGSFHVSRAYGGKGSPRLIDFGALPGVAPREQQLNACLQCHEKQESGAPQVGFSGSVHDQSPVNCSSCHEMHAEPGSMIDRSKQAEICFSCHEKIRDGHPALGGRSIATSTRPCAACHRIHPRARQRSGNSAGSPEG